VDYSWDLYHNFQSLRTYRETWFSINPEGFTVQTSEREDYHEEKIELPDGWLRGFMQLQAAMMTADEESDAWCRCRVYVAGMAEAAS
jgi:hypothetical protein